MSADQHDVMQRLADAITARFGEVGGGLTRETTSNDVHGWDSLSHAFLLLDLEQVFGFEIPPSAGVEVANVGELADLLAGIEQERTGIAAR